MKKRGGNIPDVLIEATKIDGTRGVQKFLKDCCTNGKRRNRVAFHLRPL